jgi:hypothetical protein
MQGEGGRSGEAGAWRAFRRKMRSVERGSR